MRVSQSAFMHKKWQLKSGFALRLKYTALHVLVRQSVASVLCDCKNVLYPYDGLNTSLSPEDPGETNQEVEAKGKTWPSPRQRKEKIGHMVSIKVIAQYREKHLWFAGPQIKGQRGKE